MCSEWSKKVVVRTVDTIPVKCTGAWVDFVSKVYPWFGMGKHKCFYDINALPMKFVGKYADHSHFSIPSPDATPSLHFLIIF